VYHAPDEEFIEQCFGITYLTVSKVIVW
jgi:hypothetical protein